MDEYQKCRSENPWMATGEKQSKSATKVRDKKKYTVELRDNLDLASTRVKKISSLEKENAVMRRELIWENQLMEKVIKKFNLDRKEIAKIAKDLQFDTIPDVENQIFSPRSRNNMVILPKADQTNNHVALDVIGVS